MREKLQKIIKQFFEGDNYTISIAIALTIAFILLIFSYIAFMKPNEFVSFSILDEQKEAKNYPELLVIGENNTCKLWIVVENHMEKSINCKVLLKITNQPIRSIPLQMRENRSYSATLNKGEKWEEPVEISFNETGDFHLVFELWIYNEKTDAFEFSDDFCVLSLKVIEA